MGDEEHEALHSTAKYSMTRGSGAFPSSPTSTNNSSPSSCQEVHEIHNTHPHPHTHMFALTDNHTSKDFNLHSVMSSSNRCTTGRAFNNMELCASRTRAPEAEVIGTTNTSTSFYRPSCPNNNPPTSHIHPHTHTHTYVHTYIHTYTGRQTHCHDQACLLPSALVMQLGHIVRITSRVPLLLFTHTQTHTLPLFLHHTTQIPLLPITRKNA